MNQADNPHQIMPTCNHNEYCLFTNDPKEPRALFCQKYASNCVACITELICDFDLRTEEKEVFVAYTVKNFHNKHTTGIPPKTTVQILTKALEIFTMELDVDSFRLVDCILSVVEAFLSLLPRDEHIYLAAIRPALKLLLLKDIRDQFVLNLFSLMCLFAYCAEQEWRQLPGLIMKTAEKYMSSEQETIVGLCLYCLGLCLRITSITEDHELSCAENIMGAMFRLKRSDPVVLNGLSCLCYIITKSRNPTLLTSSKLFPGVMRSLLNSNKSTTQSEVLTLLRIVLRSGSLCTVVKHFSNAGLIGRLVSNDRISALPRLLSTLEYLLDNKKQQAIKYIKLLSTFLLKYHGAMDLILSMSVQDRLLSVVIRLLSSSSASYYHIGLVSICHALRSRRLVFHTSSHNLAKLIEAADKGSNGHISSRTTADATGLELLSLHVNFVFLIHKKATHSQLLIDGCHSYCVPDTVEISERLTQLEGEKTSQCFACILPIFLRICITLHKHINLRKLQDTVPFGCVSEEPSDKHLYPVCQQDGAGKLQSESVSFSQLIALLVGGEAMRCFSSDANLKTALSSCFEDRTEILQSLAILKTGSEYLDGEFR
ncbi:unnamed protein product [Dicrocoelium dendriticum]|nr:unnamed protein product [Dicrocoelium dendriticum]